MKSIGDIAFYLVAIIVVFMASSLFWSDAMRKIGHNPRPWKIWAWLAKQCFDPHPENDESHSKTRERK